VNEDLMGFLQMFSQAFFPPFPPTLGFKINHLDLTPRFAGILMSFTNCFANFFGLLAPIVAGNIIEGKVD
jgi:hypothetical protein